uniref:Uncharacterized protein n=1 Tax=Arundo donax TaxID=35708 RepID=A0A0A9EKJ1_ARUDO
MAAVPRRRGRRFPELGGGFSSSWGSRCRRGAASSGGVLGACLVWARPCNGDLWAAPVSRGGGLGGVGASAELEGLRRRAAS